MSIYPPQLCLACSLPLPDRRQPHQLYHSNPLCRSVRYEKHQANQKIEASKKRLAESGTIYIISSRAYPGWYKVGITTQSGQDRVHNMQTYAPFDDYKLEYERYLRGYRQVELLVIKRFPNRREWVNVPIKDIKDAIDAFAFDQESGSSLGVR